MAEEVGKGGAEGGVNGDGRSALDLRGDEDVGEGDALADEEGAGGEVGLEGLQGADLALGDGIVDLFGGSDNNRVATGGQHTGLL